MVKNTSIILNDHFEAFVSERVENGRYDSASGFSDYSYEKVIQQLDGEMH